jgi:hypothetical protein
MVVPRGTKGMRDANPEVRTATAKQMLHVRYSTLPMFEATCAYPPCDERFIGYERAGKRKLYCSGKCTVAMVRLRQRQRGMRRVWRDGAVRLEYDSTLDTARAPEPTSARQPRSWQPTGPASSPPPSDPSRLPRQPRSWQPRNP